MSLSPPSTLEALVQTVADSAPAPLAIAGGRSKRSFVDGEGGSVARLDLRALTGITAYDPAECVVTALAGTPVAEVAAALAAHGQYLPWDPPLGLEGSTVGGMVASGVSGPGRYRYGGVRDFVIGARVVDGRGRLIASGGQVVKNAAGFLTHHGLVGSAGRFGVIADVSFKVFPRPERTCTLVARPASRADAAAAHERLRLANLDLDALDLDALDSDGRGTAVSARLAGTADALDARVDRALAALELPAERLSGDEEARHWQARSLAAWPASAPTVKVPTTPSRLAGVLEGLAPLGACRASVGGAVVYLHAASPLEDLDRSFRMLGLRGAVVRGDACGRRLGVTEAPDFYERVRRTLDPDDRFR